MDGWSHLLFAFTFAILLDFYPIRKVWKILIIMTLIEIINFFIAILGSDYYNAIGSMLRGPIIAYFIYLRATAINSEEKAREEKMILILFFAAYVASASHGYDVLLERLGYKIVEKSIRRGQNLWHTPFFAIIISLLLTIILYDVCKLLAKYHSNFNLRSTYFGLFFAALTGYASHIIGDFLIYDFQIFWLFPFSFVKLGILDIINQGVLTKEGTYDKPEGTTYYFGSIFFVGIFLFLVSIKYINTYQHIKSEFLSEIK